jgi:hypothetical protein
MYLSNIRGTEVINYYEVQICNGATYSDSTFTGLTAEGTYYAPVYQSESGNGCDSVVALNISYYPVTDYTGFMCYNGSYSDGNFSNLTQTGIYSITLQSVQDCDSVVRLILDYYPAIPVTDYTGLMCRRGSYSDANFSDLTESGTYSVTLQSTVHGCDSVVRLTLSYYPDIPVTSYSGQMCRRGSYSDANFNNLAQAGTYYDTLQSVVHGCDSVVRLTLGYYPAIPVTDYTGLMCYSGSYSDANFSNLTQAGTYYDTLQSLVHGCDSVVRLTLDYTAPPPLPPSICMITVDEQNHNEIVWKRREDLVFYNIYREGMQSGQYDLLATTGYDDANLWTDTSSDAKIRSYRYKVSGIDTCGNESDLSDSHKTMHLTINSGLNGSWNLIWTAYEGADYSTYNIYRATGDTLGSLMLTGSMPAGNTSYSDFSAPAGYVYYVVEIMLDNPCDVSKSLGSIKSNIATNNPGTGLNACSSLDNGKLYPNPATDHINIVLPDNAAYALFTLYDMQGKALIHQEIGNRTEEISVSSLAAGMYIYNMVTDRQKYHGKLIVK